MMLDRPTNGAGHSDQYFILVAETIPRNYHDGRDTSKTNMTLTYFRETEKENNERFRRLTLH